MSKWEQISGAHISIDHGETPQVFRDATDEELELMRIAPELKAERDALLAEVRLWRMHGDDLHWMVRRIGACERLRAENEERGLR